MSINLSDISVHDECKESRKKECNQEHTQRVANATLKLAIDVHTDFDCNPG